MLIDKEPVPVNPCRTPVIFLLFEHVVPFTSISRAHIGSPNPITFSCAFKWLQTLKRLCVCPSFSVPTFQGVQSQCHVSTFKMIRSLNSDTGDSIDMFFLIN